MRLPALLFSSLLGALLTGSLRANTDHLAALRLQSHYAPDDGVANGDLFGSAVAIEGEWAVVGAPGDDSAGLVDEGSAYILKRENDVWKVHQKLYVHENTEPYGYTSPIRFGQTVAISGDWIAIGAPNYRHNNGDYGRVRLYRRTGTKWSLQQTLTPSETTSSRRFGYSLAFSGGQYLAVGTPSASSTDLAGQVVTYRWNSASSLWESHLRMTGPAVYNTEFGVSVAMDGPLVYVGLPGYAAPATPTSRGQVRIYTLSSSGPAAPLIQTLVNPAPNEIQRFGGSMAVSGGRLLVGVRSWNIANQVIACLYLGTTLETKILAPEGFPQIASDCPVAYRDNFCLVGCPRMIGASTEVYLQSFEVSGPPQPEAFSRSTNVGPLVTGTSGVNAQLIATAGQQGLVGNPGYYLNGLSSGGVVPFVGRSQSGHVLSPPLTRLQSNDDFGKRLEADGDTILASATRWQNRGTVHVYTRKDGVWDISHSLDNPVTGRYGNRIYGEVTCVKGRWMAISSPQSGGHKILVFAFRDGQWSQTPFVIHQLDRATMHEIMSLDISGDSLVVLTTDYTKGWRAGRFRLTDSGPVYESMVIAEKPIHTAQEISLSGDRAVLMLNNTRVLPIYDTSKNPWKKVSSLPVPTGSIPLSPDYARGLNWAGKGIVMGLNTANPVAYMPSGAAWTSSQPFKEDTLRPFSMDAEGDLALLTSRSYLRLYSQRSGKWLFAKGLRPEYSYSGDYLASALTQDSLAYGKTPYGINPYATLSIYLNSAMEVYDGPTTSGQFIGRDYTLNLGVVAAAQDTPLPLTLKNTGNVTWTFAGLEAVPQIVTLPPSLEIKPVPPGGTFTLPAVLRPTVISQQRGLTLKFRVAGNTTPLATVNLIFSAQPSLPLPTDSVAGLSRLVRAGEPFTLNLYSASRSLACRWFKEGRLLPEDTTTVLFRSKATIADAGSYSVEVTAPDGAKQLLKNILLGVYEYQNQPLRVALGGTLSARARVWGPGVRYSWNTAGMDDGNIRGSKTASLQIRDFHPSSVSESTLYAFASLADTSAIVGSWPLHYNSFTELYPSGPSELAFGQDVLINGVTASGEVENLRFTATGLPPGLIFDPINGQLSGTPTKAGIYNITYRASFTGGVAKPVTDRIIVYPPGDRRLRPGTLAGVVWTGNPGPDEVTNHVEQLVPGLMQIEISTSGRATAQWQLGGRRLSAVGQFGQLHSDEHCQLIFPPALGLGPLDCRIIIFSQTQEITCEVRSELLDGKTLSWVSTLQYRAAPVTNNIRQFAGRKTTFFASAGEESSQPRGSGFGSLTITQALNVNVVGTLPDGSGITFSSMIMDGEARIPFCVDLAPEAFFTGIYGYELIEGNAYWRRPPSPGGRFYPAGFKAAQYHLSAAAYHPPAPGMLLFPQMEPSGGSASLSLISRALTTNDLNLYCKLNTAHKAVFEAPNLNQAKIDFFTSTGFFTGSAVLDDLLPGSETRRLKRTVNFRGMLSPSGGEGFFLLPMLPDATEEPPTTSANSPILSGLVIFQPSTD